MRRLLPLLLLVSLLTQTFGQTIERLDGSKLSADSLQHRIEYLMRAANVSGVAVSVFNRSQPVFSRTFGLANVPEQKAFTPNSVVYAASFAKMVFAHIVIIKQTQDIQQC